jgi:hypothetical protein
MSQNSPPRTAACHAYMRLITCLFPWVPKSMHFHINLHAFGTCSRTSARNYMLKVISQIVLNMQNGGLGNNPRPVQAMIKVLGRFRQEHSRKSGLFHILRVRASYLRGSPQLRTWVILTVFRTESFLSKKFGLRKLVVEVHKFHNSVLNVEIVDFVE